MAYEKPHSISYEMINTLDVKSDAQLILIVEKVGDWTGSAVGWHFQTAVRRQGFYSQNITSSFSILFHVSSSRDEDSQTWQHELSLTFLWYAEDASSS